MAQDAIDLSQLLVGGLSGSSAGAERDEIDTRILDAAAELVAAIGLQTTIDLVAKRAGVGRATVYRRFETKEAVFAAMALREIYDVFSGIAARAAGETEAQAKAVLLFGATFRAAVTNPILRRIAIDDPRALNAMRSIREPIDLERTMSDALRQSLDEARAQGGLPPAALWTTTITATFIRTMSGYVLQPDDTFLTDPEKVEQLASIVAGMFVDRGLSADG